MRLEAGYQFSLSDPFGLRLDYHGSAVYHQDHTEYDIIDHGISLEPQYILDQKIFSLPVSFNHMEEDGKTDAYRYTISPTYTYVIPKSTQAVALYGSLAEIDDRDDDETLNEDGTSLGLGCMYIFYFENKSNIRLTLDYTETSYDAKACDYDSKFSPTSDRNDRIVTAGVDAQWQITPHFGLYSSYSYIHSGSNVDFFDYNRNIVEAGIVIKY